MPLPAEGRLFMGALFVVFPLTSHVLSATARDAATRHDLQLLAGQGRISGMTLATTDSLLVQQVMVC
ncbi:hypothetical protein EGI20_00455 [Aquitalea sp. S1-19]|nr:hypothetical protein [Aquitalea sp. S1-19]